MAEPTGNVRSTSISLDEDLVTLTEATKLLPRVNGKRPNHSTLWRWCRRGLGGVHLEYLKVGRRIMTSRQALERFAHALAAADCGRPEAFASRQRPCSASSAEAERELESDGI